MSAYYNENDPRAAAWLRELIEKGMIAHGEVDERSIADVEPADLVGHDQCHFFAGIGGWSLALRLAGWPDERPVWTGSCPCQPFSPAGKGLGQRDERHLWPVWNRLIVQCRPPVVFGEQVASAIGKGWLDSVFTDMEGEGYACGAAVLPACSVGAPHRRDRVWFVADSDAWRRFEQREHDRDEAQNAAHRCPQRHDVGGRDEDARRRGGSMADCDRKRRETRQGRTERASKCICVAVAGGVGGSLADTESIGSREGHEIARGCDSGACEGKRAITRHDNACEPWRIFEWLPCRDGKARPTQPGLFPLAYGVSGRMAVVRPVVGSESEAQGEEVHWYSRATALRGMGNAIVPQVAAAFIEAYMELSAPAAGGSLNEQ